MVDICGAVLRKEVLIAQQRHSTGSSHPPKNWLHSNKKRTRSHQEEAQTCTCLQSKEVSSVSFGPSLRQCISRVPILQSASDLPTKAQLASNILVHIVCSIVMTLVSKGKLDYSCNRSSSCQP